MEYNTSEMKNLLVDTPNLSVMLPGRCNAKCDFCFWERDNVANNSLSKDFSSKLFDYVMELPECFRQISITGGEPTISPALDGVLAVVSRLKASKRIDKVVLTTNGVRLAKRLPDIVDCVDHINISRHHYDDEENSLIFRTSTNPSTIDLFSIVAAVHCNSPVDICFNCVVPPDVSVEFCEEFIDYGRTVGVKAVSFRIYHNAMGVCEAEKYYTEKYHAVDVSTCPVCRTARMLVDGFCVNWKYSVLEPTQHWDGVYELVMQPDGRLTADWSGKIEINPKQLEVPMKKQILASDLEIEKVRLAKELMEMAKKLLGENPSGKEVRGVHETRVVQEDKSYGGRCSHSYGGGCR